MRMTVLGVAAVVLVTACAEPSTRVWEWCWASTAARGIDADNELVLVTWPNRSFAQGCVQFCEEESHEVMLRGEAGQLLPNTDVFIFWQDVRAKVLDEVLAACSARAEQLGLSFTNAPGVRSCESAIGGWNEMFFLGTRVFENTQCQSESMDTNIGLDTSTGDPLVDVDSSD